MKKLVALLLATLMMVSCFSFATAEEPIELLFWHHAGSGGINADAWLGLCCGNSHDDKLDDLSQCDDSNSLKQRNAYKRRCRHERDGPEPRLDQLYGFDDSVRWQD